MSFVDLRRREREPAVQQLLAAGASAESAAEVTARCGAGAWVLVGWEELVGLTACAALERISREELHLRSLTFARGRDGAARCLLDALAGVATASRIAALVDAEAADLYRACGFDVASPAGGGRQLRATRSITSDPAHESALRAVTLGDVEAAIRAAWGRDTSDDPDDWSERNPARGQCGVTAALVRELLGGEILIANVLHHGARVERHAWNRLSSGVAIDLTRSQFERGETFDEPVVGEPMTMARSRFELLAGRVRAQLEAS